MQVLNPNLSEALATAVAQCSAESGFTIAYTVQNLKAGVIASRDPDISLPAASLIKLFIFAAFLRGASIDPSLPTRPVTITSHNVVLGSGVIKSLPLPQVMTVVELCRYMIQHSDNTAANLLIDLLSFAEINATARAMGADKTILNRYMMSQDENAADNFSSCNDVARFYHLLLTSAIPGVNFKWAEWAVGAMKGTKSDRLGSRFGLDAVTAAKPATGTTVIHDSVVLLNSLIVVAMIRCAKAAFNRPTSAEFATALRVFGDIGKIVFDWRPSIK